MESRLHEWKIQRKFSMFLASRERQEFQLDEVNPRGKIVINRDQGILLNSIPTISVF